MYKNNDVEELELKIYQYFIDELEYFIGEKEYESCEDALDDFCDNCLNSTLRRSFYVEDFFKPEFGISLKTLLTILQENGCLFKDYIRKIMLSYNLEKELIADGFRFCESEDAINSSQKIKEEFLGSSDSNEVTEDNVKAVKKLMIKQGVGVDNLELDNLDNEDLDRLLVKTTKVTEKVNIIKKAMKTSEKEVIAETVAKFLNMHKNEALSII